MRRLMLSLAAATIVAAGAALPSTGALAMKAGSTSGILSALESTNMVEDVQRRVCRHRYYSSRVVCYRVYRRGYYRY